MTRRREAEPITKITVGLYTADLIRLRAIYATAGYNKAVRMLVHNHLVKVDAQAEKILETEE